MRSSWWFFFVSAAVFWSWPSFSECLVLISVIIMAGVVFTLQCSWLEDIEGWVSRYRHPTAIFTTSLRTPLSILINLTSSTLLSFSTYEQYIKPTSAEPIWFWRRMMEAAPNWFPKGGKANQTDPALVWSTPLSSVQQSAHWSNQLSNQAPSHPIDPRHIHLSQVTDENKNSWNVVTFHS